MQETAQARRDESGLFWCGERNKTIAIGKMIRQSLHSRTKRKQVRDTI